MGRGAPGELHGRGPRRRAARGGPAGLPRLAPRRRALARHAGALDARHLARLRALADRIEPCLVSEHLSWSIAGGAYLNHLLPLPYTEETLAVVAEHVGRAQDALGRRILIENPSSYLRFRHSTIAEPELLAALVDLTGCGLLCDVNNVFVTAHNLGLDPVAYLDALPADAVGEIHLAGHAANDADGHTILIDDHGSPVAAPVWALYAHALARFGAVPTLIEWDTDIPELGVLMAEAATADRLIAAASRSRPPRRSAMPALRDLQAAIGTAMLGGDARAAAREIEPDGLAPEARLEIYRHHVLPRSRARSRRPSRSSAASWTAASSRMPPTPTSASTRRPGPVSSSTGTASPISSPRFPRAGTSRTCPTWRGSNGR